MASRKGTNTGELVRPMCRGGGRHDLMLRGAATPGDGLSKALTGKSARSHWTTMGPEADGMVTCWPAGVRLHGRILSSSPKIWVLTWEGNQGCREPCVEGSTGGLMIWRW